MLATTTALSADASKSKRARSARAKRPRLTEEERFDAKRDKSGGPDACWTWMAGTSHADGYGKFGAKIDGKWKTVGAHRYAFQLANPTVGLLRGVEILHASCCGQNRLCCNPRHLRIGSHQENARQAAVDGALGKRKLTAAKACEIVQLYACGIGVKPLSERFDVTPVAIRHVIHGRSWARATADLRARLAQAREAAA